MTSFPVCTCPRSAGRVPAAACDALAGVGVEAIRLLDELGAGQRPRWTLVDAPWTPALANAASQDNGSLG